MTRDAVHQKLEEIKQYLHEKFAEDVDRLRAVDAHTATVGMYVDSIHDEAAKRAIQGS